LKEPLEFVPVDPQQVFSQREQPHLTAPWPQRLITVLPDLLVSRAEIHQSSIEHIRGCELDPRPNTVLQSVWRACAPVPDWVKQTMIVLAVFTSCSAILRRLPSGFFASQSEQTAPPSFRVKWFGPIPAAAGPANEAADDSILSTLLQHTVSLYLI
jgi:hypothetical protein